MFEKFKLFLNLFKVRISLTIVLCAISGVFIVPNNNLNTLELFLVAISVFLASAGVSAFNQYFELRVNENGDENWRYCRTGSSGR